MGNQSPHSCPCLSAPNVLLQVWASSCQEYLLLSCPQLPKVKSFSALQWIVQLCHLTSLAYALNVAFGAFSDLTRSILILVNHPEMIPPEPMVCGSYGDPCSALPPWWSSSVSGSGLLQDSGFSCTSEFRSIEMHPFPSIIANFASFRVYYGTGQPH